MAGNSEISEGELKREEESDCDLFEFGDDLELNQFDGLPYSSRYYRLLQERKTLPVWKYRHEFMTLLEKNQIVIVSGTTKTGKSTQVSMLIYHAFTVFTHHFVLFLNVNILNFFYDDLFTIFGCFLSEMCHWFYIRLDCKQAETLH